MTATGETPTTSTAAPAPSAPAAPAAPTPATTATTPEAPGGSDTPAPVTSQSFAEGFAQAEAKAKADADARRAERAAKKAEAAAKPPVEPTTMPETVEPKADDTDDATADDAAESDESETDDTPPVIAAPKKDGPVPLERHKRAVDNARAKGIEEAVAEVTKHYPWVGKVDPREIEQGLALREAVRRNPAALAQRLLARSGSAAPAGEAPDTLGAMPDPDVQTEDGRVKMYSEAAHKRSLAILARRLGEAFQAELAEVKSFVAEQRQAKAQVETERVVNDRVESLMKLPGAQEYLEDIVNLMESDGRLSDIGAYNRIVPAKLAEENARLKAKQAEEEARFKAGAGTVNPARAGTGTVGKRVYKADTDGFMRALQESAR
jgi:hypothetical protein